jgi:hypothetical protein
MPGASNWRTRGLIRGGSHAGARRSHGQYGRQPGKGAAGNSQGRDQGDQAMTAIKVTTDQANLPWHSSSPVLHITNYKFEHYTMHVRIEDGALVIGSRDEYIVLSQADAANFQAAFDAFATTGTFS